MTAPYARSGVLPGAHADLVAFHIDEHPERSGMGIAHQDPARRECGWTAYRSLLVGDVNIEMDAIALGTRNIHLLKPARRQLTCRIG